MRSKLKFVHIQKLWLCASADDIENKDPKQILEVKCPISSKNKTIIDLKKKKCNLLYLEYKNNKILTEWDNKNSKIDLRVWEFEFSSVIIKYNNCNNL